MTVERVWRARWINGEGGAFMGTPPSTAVTGAPYLRTTFDLAAAPGAATAWLSAPGWHELYVNGQKADDRVLSPVVTQFDRHVAYIKYDVAALLRPGRNAVAVVLGNGWYNCHTPDAWEFDHAPWRDYPKLLCEVEVDGEVVAASGPGWKTARSPIVFDGLRNGEHYDARLETPGFADPDFDDGAWGAAALCNPPGGLLELQDVEPCKVMRRYAPAAMKTLPDGSRVYDFGTNLTGWCALAAAGKRGAEIVLLHGERLDAGGDLERSDISRFVRGGGFQEDHYTLKGEGVETWQPRFTYHGFRYVKVVADFSKLKTFALEACFVHNSFAPAGSFASSDATLNKLQQMTAQSYLSNFTGIPTDCPHREKNGWTGDANLALETGLWNFDARKAYRHFARVLADCQRPNGQFPGIAPSGGWGYNWGSGPAWDSFLFEAAEKLYLYCGDDSVIREHYAAMGRYLGYCESMAMGDLVAFGLGDWCHPDSKRITPVEVTSSGYFYADAARMARFAALLGRREDELRYQVLAARVRAAFNAKFYRPEDHSYADGAPTALGAALYFGLCEEAEAPAVAARLAAMARANAHKADFGILGAKYIPRALADHGYAADAFALLTQPEFPGWGHWVAEGATTLREMWDGGYSQNHVMFGDVSAWMYQYLGGIAPLWEGAGFRRFRIRPCFVPQLTEVTAEHRAPAGLIRSAWKREGDAARCSFAIPAGCVAEIVLPGQTVAEAAGEVSLTCRVPE